MQPSATRSGSSPAISAVVVSYNGGERTLRTLRALRDQETQLAAVILVDNGSDDGTPARVREDFPEVQILDLGGNHGLPAARNAGLRHAATGLVLLLDHDVYLAPDCIARLAQHLAGADGSTAVVCPRIRLVPEFDTVQADGTEAHFLGTMTLRHGHRPLAALPSGPVEVGGCLGACMLVRRDAALEAGGFDELFFFYLEDHEFSVRMRSRGHRIVCEPRAEVFHERAAGTPGLSFRGAGAYPPRRTYLTLRHRLVTLLVHYRIRTLVLLAPALASAEILSLGAALGRGHGRQWLASWAWVLGHPGEILRRRRWVQRARRVGDRALLTGGPLPLAPGSIRGPGAAAAARWASTLLDGYWRLVRRAIP
jgi:GT2 family glycosyltransferase